MVNQKKTFKMVVALVAFVVVIGLIFVGLKNKKKDSAVIADPENTGQQSKKTQNFENKVLIEVNDGTVNSVDISTGKAFEASALENEDFSSFAGLPKFEENEIKNVGQSALFSRDKSQTILTFSKYDGLENQTKTLLSSEKYLCQIAEKKCQQTEILTQVYQGLEQSLQNGSSSFIWTDWDSDKKKIFGHMVSVDGSDVSPMYECDTEKKSCAYTVGYNSQEADNTIAMIPNGSLSPSLEKFVMVVQNDKPNEETGQKWELLLYGSDDISKPQSFDISVAIDMSEDVAYDGVHSVAWNASEDKIAIGTTRRIFIFDVATGGLSLAYIAPADEDGDFYWDSSKLFLSPDASSVAFVDVKDILTESDDESDDFDETTEDTDITLNVLKRIDLKNANVVSELLQGEGLSLK